MNNVFIHIPKTAGNSIRESLNSLGVNYLDLGHSNLKNQGIDHTDNFSFCFVRNPYARIRSAFYHLIDIDIDEALKSNSKFANKRAKLFQKYGRDFEGFIMDRGFEKFDFSHFYPQVKWVYEEGKRVVNYIGYLEDIDNDFNDLSSIIGTRKTALSKINATNDKKYKKNEILSDEAVSIIKNYYQEDFLKLGYSFNPEFVFPKKKSGIVSKFHRPDELKKKELLSNKKKLSNGSEYLYSPLSGSKDLIIILSTHNQYNNFFALDKLIACQEQNLLFITNYNNNYYADFCENSDNFYESFIKNFITEGGYENVTIFGSSMAGFAALYISGAIGVNAFVTNPQVDLELSHSLAWPGLRATLENVNSKISLNETLNNDKAYVYYLYGSAKIDFENAKELERNLKAKDNFIFRHISDEGHNFPFPDNLEIINSVHEHLSLMKRKRI